MVSKVAKYSVVLSMMRRKHLSSSHPNDTASAQFMRRSICGVASGMIGGRGEGTLGMACACNRSFKGRSTYSADDCLKEIANCSVMDIVRLCGQ